MKIKKNFGRIFISLIVSIVTFVGLLVMQQTILAPNGTSNVFIAKENIEKNTIITADNIDKLFKMKKVDGELKVTNAVTNKKDIINKLVNKNLEKGSVISNNSFIDKNDIISKIKNPVEVSFKVNDISQVVGGTLRAGDIIDVSVTNEVTKENTDVLNNVYVDKTFTNEGKEIKKEDTSSAVAINIIVSKEDEAKLNKEIALGTIRISRIK